jgi:sugar lactone lactonase YvrE
VNIELVLDAKAIIGESPLWVASENALYWADIKAPALHRLNLATQAQNNWALPADIGGFALDGHGRALVALRNGLQWLDLASNTLTLLAPPPFDPKLIRFNEAACDSFGRFWVGVMTDPAPDAPESQSNAEAMLYSFTEADGLRAHMDFTHLTNGMAFSADETAFYISHSNARKIYKFAYDRRAGTIGARTEFASLDADTPGIPDGAALDAAGNYWCAIHGGGRLHRYTPDGALAGVIMLPVSQPTMCCFAGENLDELYITSAREKLSAADLEREPHAGGVFRIRPGVAGQPKNWRVP